MEQQSEAIKVTCYNEKTVAKSSEDEIIVDVNVIAPYFVENKRAPIDLVAIIDRSGSMSDKILLVKDTLTFIVKQLNSKDKFGIIIYDHEVEEIFPLKTMDAMAKDRAFQAIKNIIPRGSTDLCSGLLRGIKEIIKTEQKNEVSSILLLTDGLANHGTTSAEGILTKMNDVAVEGKIPCSVHTFGYGSDHDPNLLKQIADKAQGIYFFIENKDVIANAFADCLGGLLSVVGQNIFLNLEGVNNTKIEEVLTGYKVTTSESTHVVHLGDIQCEEERDILCKLKISPVEQPTESQEILKVSLSYFNVVTSKQEEVVCTSFVERGDKLAAYHDRVDKQKNRLLVADAITSAKTLGDSGKYEEARTLIQNTISKLSSSISAEDPYVKELQNDLKVVLKGLHDGQSYTSGGSYAMASISSSHYQQRSTISTVSYKTRARTMVSSKVENQTN